MFNFEIKFKQCLNITACFSDYGCVFFGSIGGKYSARGYAVLNNDGDIE